MFQINFSIFNRQPSIIVDDALPLIGKGTHVVVDTLCYGQQLGVIERIGLSPYYPECNEGVQRAYVIGQGWSDYILVEELFLESDACDCTDCDHKHPQIEMCSECGLCNGCCSCAPSWLDDPEFEDYADSGEDYEYDSYKDDLATGN